MTTSSNPDVLAELRPIQSLRPGQWLHGEYEDDDGQPFEMWSEVRVVMNLENVVTGQKSVRVLSVGTDGSPTELHQVKGFACRSLTVPQGRKCGLAIAPAPEDGGEQ
jgi:hypothetical protein